MATKNHIGKTLYIATAHPATNDAAGFEALTWVKVEGTQQAPQFGITHAMIDIPDLQTGFTKTVKGAGTGVDTQAMFRKVDSDTGQASVETTANDDDGIASLKLVDGTGVNNAPVAGDPVEYAQGFLHSYQDMQPNTTNYEGFTVSFRQNDFTVKATEPV